MANYGYSGSSFDRWVGEQSLNHGTENALNKMQHQFWVAKQSILRRMGKKEDDCLIASDAELDAKLELFLSIQETCSQLHKVVEQYQERLAVLAQEEYSFGTFLRNHGELDKTRAGKMMNAVGKAMIYTSQQRTCLRAPLCRLHQEVETFCQRAVEDTSFTVNEMEKCRNDYRGALLWMKNVSQELDPDTFKQLEKFRRVQSHVRGSKTKFDRHKLACLQKIDLLAAARCNMFSHGLIVYQDNMAVFWQKTSSALTTVSEAYKGYQPYEFTYVKELAEPSSKLAAKHAGSESQSEFFFESEFRDEEAKKPKSEAGLLKEKNTSKTADVSSKTKSKSKSSKKQQAPESKPLLDTGDLLGLDFNQSDESDALLLELASLDFGQPSNTGTDESSKGQINDDDPLLGQDSFQANFEQVFGAGGAASDSELSQLLPSHFLSSNLISTDSLLEPHSTSFESPQHALIDDQRNSLIGEKPMASKGSNAPPKNKGSGKDMSAWYNLFADLDPLGNPDALSRNKKDDDDRNC